MSETTLNAGLQTMTAPPTVGPPLWLLAEITYSCPLHCVFCYNPVDYTQSGAELSTEEWFKVLRDARAAGSVQCGFSGGEPLLVKNNEKLLSQITNENLPIRINSNISQANDSNRVLNQLKRFKNVLWTVSAESSHARFEYTRSNGNWEKFIDNLQFIKSLGHQMRLNSVFFVGSAAYLFDTLEYYITEHSNKDITINQLLNHPNLHVKHCPPEVKQMALSKLKKILASDLI
jgi:MoaA/NifB/PqqE/SkfB family radical SAM enzyme